MQEQGLSDVTAAMLRRKLPVMVPDTDRRLRDKEKVANFERTLHDLMSKKDRTLNLANDKIGAAGAAALAAALKENASLQKLSLWNNQIGDAGAERIKSDKRIYS